MPTYGKKKKDLASSFAFSQEEKTKSETSRYPSTYARLENVRTALSRTRSRVKLDVETGGVGEIDQFSVSTNNHNVPMSLQMTSETAKSNNQSSDDPLQPMLSSHEHLGQNRHPLEARATNAQVLEKPHTLVSDLSFPFSKDVVFNLNKPRSRPGTSSTTARSTQGLQTTLADVDEIHEKITDLKQQADIQEEDTKRKAELYAAYPSKMSPFNWGKKAFVKATHAIRDRLSNHSTTTPPNKRLDMQRHQRLQQSSDASSVNDSDDDDTKKRLIRYVAERRNFAKPKIQTLVGDEDVPRKPLPVYESMKSRSLRSGSEEDPFSDGFEAPVSPYSQIDGKLDIDFNKRTHGNVKAREQDSASGRTDENLDSLQQQLAKSKSSLGFSNKISGLAQHPNVMDFSSSPLGFSTPRIRIEPQTSAQGPKAVPGVLTRSPSIIEFSFEGQSDDEVSMAQSTHSKSVTDGSQSIKRKSAQSDLGTSTISTSKKSKLASGSSNEKENIALGYSKLDAEDEKLPLSPKDKNIIPKQTGKQTGKGGRLTIFELGKERAPEEGRKARPRPIIGKRTSFPRPSSMFPIGREPRPGMRRLTSIDADMMDIDELQVDDSTYQVGRKWN